MKPFKKYLYYLFIIILYISLIKLFFYNLKFIDYLLLFFAIIVVILGLEKYFKSKNKKIINLKPINQLNNNKILNKNRILREIDIKLKSNKHFDVNSYIKKIDKENLFYDFKLELLDYQDLIKKENKKYDSLKILKNVNLNSQNKKNNLKKEKKFINIPYDNNLSENQDIMKLLNTNIEISDKNNPKFKIKTEDLFKL